MHCDAIWIMDARYNIQGRPFYYCSVAVLEEFSLFCGKLIRHG